MKIELLHLSILVLGLGVSTQASLAEASISKKQVDDYAQRSKSEMIEYECQSQTKNCSVVCSSGGSEFMTVDNAVQAFYGLRRNSVNGSISGYYLAVDAVGTSSENDVWVNLQVHSSCMFKGMRPKR